MVSGEIIGALGITEPSAGSDVRGIRTTVRRDGGELVINGQKTYISNGQLCDFVMLVCKSDPARPREAISLVIVETDRPSFARGRKLKKLGLKAQDTSELFFENVRVPLGNLIGTEHEGFSYLVRNLAHERLVQAVRGLAVAEFQNTQFKLAELKAATVAARVFVGRCITLQLEGALDPVDAAAVKLIACDLHCKVVDECLRLHGGWGYMWEYPVCRAYADARIVKIAGGSMEVMKQIIARDLFKGTRSSARRAPAS